MRGVLTINFSGQNNLLDNLYKGTVIATGKDFFPALVQSLGRALGVQHSFVSEFIEQEKKVYTLSFWSGDTFSDNIQYGLKDTPCEAVLAGETKFYPENIQIFS